MAQAAAKSVTAENQWSDPVQIAGIGSLTVRGTFVATVSLQVRADGVNWVTVPMYRGTDAAPITGEDHRGIYDYSGSDYRAGVATGAFTSGTVEIYLKGSHR
jgi:hypothetical protein